MNVTWLSSWLYSVGLLSFEMTIDFEMPGPVMTTVRDGAALGLGFAGAVTAALVIETRPNVAMNAATAEATTTRAVVVRARGVTS